MKPIPLLAVVVRSVRRYGLCVLILLTQAVCIPRCSAAQDFQELPGQLKSVVRLSPNGNYIVSIERDDVQSLPELRVRSRLDSSVVSYGVGPTDGTHWNETFGNHSISPVAVSNDGIPSVAGHFSDETLQGYLWVDGAIVWRDDNERPTQSTMNLVSSTGSVATGRQDFRDPGSFVVEDGVRTFFPNPPGGEFWEEFTPQALSSDGRVMAGIGTGQALVWSDSAFIKLGPATVVGAVSDDGKTVLVNRTGQGTALWRDGAFQDIAPFAASAGNRVNNQGTVVVSHYLSPEYHVWLACAGHITTEQALRDFAGPLPDGWTNYEVRDLSADGTVWVGRAVEDNVSRFWWADMPALAAMGKNDECECRAPDVLWSGPDDGSINDADHWDSGALPTDTETAVFPYRENAYGVTGAAARYGALRFEGVTELAGLIELMAPCGDALTSPGDVFTTELVVHGSSDLTLHGAIRLPSQPDHGATLSLEDGTRVLGGSLYAAVGTMSGSSGDIRITGRSDWFTPDGAIDIGGAGFGNVEVQERSSLETGRVTVGAPGGDVEESRLEVTDSRLRVADLIVGGGSPGALQASDGLFELRRFTSGAGGPAYVSLSGSLVGSEATVFGVSDSVRIEGKGTAWSQPDGDLVLAEGASAYADVEFSGEGAGLFEPLRLVVGSGGEAELRIRDEAYLESFNVTVGAEEGARGRLRLEDESFDDRAIPALTSVILVVGDGGTGELAVVNTSAKPGEVMLGIQETGEGSLLASNAFIDEIDRLTVGVRGRGDVRLADTTGLFAQEIVLGDSLGGFGSMNVDATSTVATLRLCVGCYEGFGILGVDGNVQTTVLRVGRLGTIRGPVVYVRRVRADKAASRQDEAGFVTEALYLSGDATLEVDALVVEDGTLGGTATWPADFTNTGTLSPGDSARTAGTFTVDADYTQDALGALEIELGGTAEGGYDVLAVSGTATLDGTLRLALLPDSRPEVGHTFEIVTAGSVTGAFETVEAQEGILAEVDYGETAVTVTLTEVSTTPVEEPDPELPAAYALAQNYPNPFNPATAIRYELPEPAQVRLAVYDLLGRRVAMLADGRAAAGRHEVVFEAGVLPSGVYVYRLEAGGRVFTRRMLLVK